MPILTKIIASIIEDTPTDDLAQIHSYLMRQVEQGKPRRHGSLCSGTEFGRYTHIELLSQLKIPLEGDEHTAVFEKEEWRRRFIYAHFPTIAVVGVDVTEFSANMATTLNPRTGGMVEVPITDESDIGFSCAVGSHSCLLLCLGQFGFYRRFFWMF